MVDVRSLYEGIIAPQGGLYQPQGSGIYDGIIPPPLTTRSVPTIPVNASNWDNPAGVRKVSAPTVPSHAMMQAMRDPGYDATRETIVPGGTRQGVGYGAGHAYGPSYRLLPDVGTPAVAAIEQAAPNRFAAYRATPHMALTKPPTMGGPVHNLTPLQDAEAQEIADELRMPVRTSRGAVVRPSRGTQLPSQSVVAKPAQARPRSLFDAFMRGGLSGLFPTQPAAMSRAPAVAAFQQQGMTPSQAYSAAAAPAYAPPTSSTNPHFQIWASGGGGESFNNSGGASSLTR